VSCHTDCQCTVSQSFLQYHLYCAVREKHPNWLKISCILHDNVAAHSVLLVFLALEVGGGVGEC